MGSHSKVGAVLGVAVLLVACRAATASTYNYTSSLGTNVSYTGISETTDPGNPTSNALYGAPNRVGDSLTFRPANFQSSSKGVTVDLGTGATTPNFQTVAGTLNYTISSGNGTDINSVTLRESGDYTLQGVAWASIFAEVDWTITAGAGNFSGPISGKDYMAFVPDQSFSNSSGIAAGVTWSGQVRIDFAAKYPAIHATSVDFAVSNVLYTETDAAGSNALLRKKSIGETPALGVVVNEAVPLPGALWAGLSLLSGLGSLRVARRIVRR